MRELHIKDNVLKKKRVCLYARVSKVLEQNPENQLIELRKWAAMSDYIVVGEFIDEVSSKDTRPQKEAVLKLLRLGNADAVAFFALDRWGRSITELVLELEEFSKSGQSLISLKEGIDLSTAAGRLMANVLAAMANFERDRIKERTNLGLQRATAQGKIKGRHPKNCGCGKKLDNGSIHNGDIKPIRDNSNQIIGWNGLDESLRLKRRARERAKELPMKDKCEVCLTNSERLERHHPDYNKAKDFITVCRKCHDLLEKQTPSIQPQLNGA